MIRLRTIVAAASLAFGAALPAGAAAQAPVEPGLGSFSSDAELRAFLRRVIAEHRRELRRNPPLPAMVVPPPAPPAAEASTAAADGITNAQVAGVDEGGIVKLSGDNLVILRRGRLFAVSLRGGGLRPVSAIDAFPPGVDASGDWYDEMLVSGDRVIVIGYSYRRRTSEVNRFRIDADGRLRFDDSYQLRSSDYYSSRNYATRLIGSRLVLYSPLNLKWDGDPLDSLPAMRQWRPGAAAGPFRRTAGASSVFVPEGYRDPRLRAIQTLHSVTSCDLAAAVLDCESTVVLGTWSRTFFVSANAVYLWVDSQGRRRARGPHALVYRMPFDSGRPSAVGVRGSPVDQFGFMPDSRRNMLHVLVRAWGGGDGMWAPEATAGDVALLSIPMSLFGDGAGEVPLDHYQHLPKPQGQSWNLQNRWVGEHLLYGSPSPGSGSVTVVELEGRGVTRLTLGHGVERLDAIGRDGVAIGTGDGALGFTAIELGGAGPRVGAEFRLPAARQGESRSHGFYFRADPGAADGSSGLLGLPVARLLSPPGSWPQRVSAAMLFLRRSAGRLSAAGELEARSFAGTANDDACQASCVDWYGNARPIFIRGRIFALLGYELVEGAEERGRIREIGRTSFAPTAAARN